MRQSKQMKISVTKSWLIQLYEWSFCLLRKPLNELLTIPNFTPCTKKCYCNFFLIQSSKNILSKFGKHKKDGLQEIKFLHTLWLLRPLSSWFLKSFQFAFFKFYGKVLWIISHVEGKDEADFSSSFESVFRTLFVMDSLKFP